jgi:hypothetical protein
MTLAAEVGTAVSVIVGFGAGTAVLGIGRESNGYQNGIVS